MAIRLEKIAQSYKILHHLAMNGKKPRIYLDYASAPPVCDAALAAMREEEGRVGNPGALHAEGVAAKQSLERSREQVARFLEVKPREIIFTPGLTASNALAIVGRARWMQEAGTLRGSHWIVSAIEHSSVLACFAEVRRMGADVSEVMPDARGIVTPDAVRALVRPETVFVSIGWANGEIGIIQPLSDIARVLRAGEQDAGRPEHSIIFHADAGQAPVYLSTLAHSLGVDLLSLGANKLYGPHGIGALYVRGTLELSPLLFGGGQERGMWAGTESVALAAGFAAAYSDLVRVRKDESARIRELRDAFAQELLEKVPGLVVNGDPRHSLPHLLDVSIPDVSSEYLVLALDHAGIAVSTKSACREGETASHVVEALGQEAWRARHTIRFSLGCHTTKADLMKAAETVLALVLKLK